MRCNDIYVCVRLVGVIMEGQGDVRFLFGVAAARVLQNNATPRVYWLTGWLAG